MNRITNLVLSVALTAFASVASAEDVYCVGTVSNLYVEANGEMTIRTSYRNSYTAICNIKVPREGIDPQVCLVWFAILHKANIDNSQVIIRYPTAPGTCGNLPEYTLTPAPGYVMDYR